MALLRIRWRKLFTSIVHPSCWRGLRIGVAPSVEHLSILRSLDVDGIIDVGANRGQFTLACQLAQPGKAVVAFEPIPGEAKIFRKVHGLSSNVTLVESALGESKGTATLHLSQSADSSSLLPIGRRQTECFRDTAEVGTIDVPVQRLDDLSDLWSGRSRQLLKLDVQGYELNVLKGAVQTLSTARYVYAECSDVELYEGQALKREVADFLQLHGFSEVGRYNAEYQQSQLIQADYLFERNV
ncbi:MAG: FkbM family methyltransferase [Pirellulaceae bacterium]|nr:FkbM family methyltransferase [Pirellulaceae bacterium]